MAAIKCKIEKVTEKYTEFDYATSKNVQKIEKNIHIIVTVPAALEDAAYDLLGEYFEVSRCPEVEHDGDTVTITETILGYDTYKEFDSEAPIKEFKQALKGLKVAVAVNEEVNNEEVMEQEVMETVSIDELFSEMNDSLFDEIYGHMFGEPEQEVEPSYNSDDTWITSTQRAVGEDGPEDSVKSEKEIKIEKT